MRNTPSKQRERGGSISLTRDQFDAVLQGLADGGALAAQKGDGLVLASIDRAVGELGGERTILVLRWDEGPA